MPPINALQSIDFICRCSVFTARSIFSVDTGFRLSDDQYVTDLVPSNWSNANQSYISTHIG